METTTTKALHFLDYHAQWDPDMEIWEVFIDEECEGYVGVADTFSDALRVAKWHHAEIE